MRQVMIVVGVLVVLAGTAGAQELEKPRERQGYWVSSKSKSR